MPTTESYSTRLGARGRVVVPQQVRERLRLEEGDKVIYLVDDQGEVRMTTARQVAERFHGYFRDHFPGRSLADELIAERREEARREER